MFCFGRLLCLLVVECVLFCLVLCFFVVLTAVGWWLCYKYVV